MKFITENKSVVIFAVALILGIMLFRNMGKPKESGYCGCGK